MSDPYERVKAGRLAFKGGTLASRTTTTDKKKRKKKKDKNPNAEEDETLDDKEKQGGDGEGSESAAGGGGEEETYTIDAAKRMKYEQLFPVEAKKFGYQPKSNVKSVEDALDDRVKKKADRYCK